MVSNNNEKNCYDPHVAIQKIIWNMVLHVYIQSEQVIKFIVHVCKANLVDFMTQLLCIKNVSLLLFFKKILTCNMSRKSPVNLGFASNVTL